MKLLIENGEIINNIPENNINVDRLLIKLIKSCDIESFLTIFPTDESTKDSSEPVFNLKTALESKKKDLEAILSLANPDNLVLQLDASSIMKYAAEFKFDHKLLDTYWKIDPDFVNNFTLPLNSKIIRIINEFGNLKSIDDKIIHLFSAYVYINLIPRIESTDMPLTQYESILDFTIEMIKSNVTFDLTLNLIRNIFCVPFVEVTESGLEKLFYIYTEKLAGNMYYWDVTMAWIVLSQNNAFEIFEMIYKFYESKQIDFNAVALLLVRFIHDKSTLFDEVFEFCEEHKLLNKSQIDIIEKSSIELESDEKQITTLYPEFFKIK